MTGWSKQASLWFVRALAICAALAIFAFTGGRLAAQSKPWIAPDDARKVKNPVPATPENLEAADGLYKDNCVLCHGEKGKGDNYCLGSEEAYSILDIAKMFGGPVTMLPPRKGNRMTAGIDVSRSMGELGWHPEKNIRDYIQSFKAGI